jgi:hypothetical protein
MLHEVAKREAFSHVERSFHFIHRIEPARSFRIANRNRAAAIAACGTLSLGW